MHRTVTLCLRTALIAGGLLWTGKAVAPETVHAAGCTPVASPAADIAPSAGFSTPAAVVASFDNARLQEGCSVALSIDQSTFAGLSPQQQMLALFNAERTDRGLGSLSLDTTLMSQIDLNHSREMAQYKYFNHPSPINQPGSVFNRLLVNPAIKNGWSSVAENIAAGYSTAAAAVYAYMYQDSGESWGHRQNILGYSGGTFGAYNWVGIGYATGGQYGAYYTSDFLTNTSYSPPGLDSTPPTASQPIVTSGSLTSGGTLGVKVTGVSDAGAQSGEASVTGVVFYANTPISSTGTYTTVSATQVSTGTWTATLSGVPANATIHAVAVDGSGNYTDCAIGSSSCAAGTGGSGGGGSSQPLLTVNPTSANPGASVTTSGSGFSSGETVDLYWNSTSSTPIASTTVSSTGTFSLSVTVPSNATPSSTGTIIAVGQTAGDSASAAVQVTAPVQTGTSVAIQPGSGVHGSYARVSGSGYHAGEYVLLRWNCASAACTGYTNLGYTRASASGAISVTIRIPTTSLGTHALGALGNTSHLFATTTFNVTG